MNTPVQCPKCQGTMAEGFIVEVAESGRTVSHWVAGEPEFGLFGGVKTRAKVQLPVKTFRCQNCGYLESYAPAD